jgi:acyl-CoA thioesterase I
MSMKTLIVGLLGALACTSPRTPPKVEKEPASAIDSRVADAPKGTKAQTDAYGPAGNRDSSRGKVTVLFFGTSLTAGLGLPDVQHAFPNLVAEKASASGTPIEAINAGLSGETSAGAVRRIEWTLKRPVDVVVLETGGNDALRALDPDTLKDNLEQIVTKIRSTQPKARIVLVQMEAPPNLGAAYTSRFRRAYADVAARDKITLAPFLLSRVAGITSLNQADGVHPNEKGEAIVADNIWQALKPVLRLVSSARGETSVTK